MKRPKEPKNKDFWLRVVSHQELYCQFLERGNGEQKKELERARKYLKWLNIQKNKGVK